MSVHSSPTAAAPCRVVWKERFASGPCRRDHFPRKSNPLRSSTGYEAAWAIFVVGVRRTVAGTREGEEERRTFALFGFHPDTAAVRFNDPLANRQTRPRAFHLFTAMQTAKHAENLLMILRFDANAIVADEQRGQRQAVVATVRCWQRPNDDFGLRVLVVAQRVGDEIGQHLHDTFGIAHNRWQKAFDAHDGLGSLDQIVQAIQYRLNRRIPVERMRGVDDATGAAEHQQIVDQPSQPTAALDQMVDVLAPFRPQNAAIILLQKLAERLNRPQRLLRSWATT